MPWPERTCDICLRPITDDDNFQVSLTGEVVHVACLETIQDDDEEDEERGE